MNKYQKIVLLGVLLGIVGCANLNSIHRKTGINPGGQTEFIDAKQRSVLVNPVYDTAVEDHKEEMKRQSSYRRFGTARNNSRAVQSHKHDNDGQVQIKPLPPTLRITQPKYRMCAEPAPDVFSIYALAATAQGNIETNPVAGGAPGQTRAGGNFALSSSETASTIERTQTINLMRESMYRTCERYLSGAISAETMQIQAARDQRAMVAILAIEQLTGIVKRAPAILTTKTQATQATANAEIVQQWRQESEDLKAKEEEVKKSQEEYNTAKSNYKALNLPEPPATVGKCDLLESTALPQPVPTPTPAETGSTTIVDKSEATTNADGTEKKTETKITTKSEPEKPDTSAADKSAKQMEEKSQCLALKKKMTDADAVHASNVQAKEAADKKLKSTQKFAENIGANLQITSASGEGQGDSGSNALAALDRIKVAEVIGDITKWSFDNQTEIVFTCTQVIRNENRTYNYATIKVCANILLKQSTANITAQQATNARQNSGYIDTKALIDALTKRQSNNNGTPQG